MNAEIVIVANKWWEVTPLLAVLQHPDARPPTILPIAPQEGSRPAGLRLVAQCLGQSLEVWCIQDLMAPWESESLTWEKARVLPQLLQGNVQPKLVIGFGTAACPAGSGYNGNVVVGSSVFVHDPYSIPPNPAKHWTHKQLNQVVPSPAEQLLSLATAEVGAAVGERLLQPPNAAATPPQLSVGANLIGLAVVNVTNRDDYVWTDKQTLERFHSSTSGLVPASLETTHGVIRLVLDQPFLFVSGLANAVGKYAQEVLPRKYAQNFVAAHNAAVALAWVVSALAPHI